MPKPPGAVTWSLSPSFLLLVAEHLPVLEHRPVCGGVAIPHPVSAGPRAFVPITQGHARVPQGGDLGGLGALGCSWPLPAPAVPRKVGCECGGVPGLRGGFVFSKVVGLVCCVHSLVLQPLFFVCSVGLVEWGSPGHGGCLGALAEVPRSRGRGVPRSGCGHSSPACTKVGARARCPCGGWPFAPMSWAFFPSCQAPSSFFAPLSSFPSTVFFLF